ncbi:MAG: lasso peptide biosynthesis B2 protein [Spirochaetaceae bacterium]|nr:MAG: lasso peptide biosynthesis B2 protein [Spirochaetaceae bacterium]
MSLRSSATSVRTTFVSFSPSLKSKVLSLLPPRKLRTLVALSRTERIAAVRICLRLVQIRFRLARWPFPAVLRHVRIAAARCRKIDDPAMTARRIGGWVARAARVLPGRYLCLPQALTAYVECSRYGLDPKLRVGVMRSADARFEAHAWLEHDGEIVVGYLPNLDEFRVFDRAGELVK